MARMSIHRFKNEKWKTILSGHFFVSALIRQIFFIHIFIIYFKASGLYSFRIYFLVAITEIQGAESIKFLGVLLDENVTWKPLVKYIENKIAKNISLLFKSKSFLDKESLFNYIIPIFIATLIVPVLLEKVLPWKIFKK